MTNADAVQYLNHYAPGARVYKSYGSGVGALIPATTCHTIRRHALVELAAQDEPLTVGTLRALLTESPGGPFEAWPPDDAGPLVHHWPVMRIVGLASGEVVLCIGIPTRGAWPGGDVSP